MARPQVLILGGQGRIGGRIAQDVIQHTDAQVTVTGRRAAPSQFAALAGDRLVARSLDLANPEQIREAIARANLVIHCAGPFHHRDGRVLKSCIEQGVNYLDVSDCVPFTQRALMLNQAAQAAGITAIINTGVFPGISNSMARQCMEAFDQVAERPQEIFLGYGVGGSGGAGVTVMRTTFLGLLQPFSAWVDGQWQQRWPYRDRQVVDFPNSFGPIGVYWYEVSETYTLAKTFPVKTVVTKFGSAPDLYNRLTSLVARWCPKPLLKQPMAIELLSQISYGMTQVSDRWSGTGIGIWAEVTGEARRYRATFAHPDTAIAAGAGTGNLAALLLRGDLAYPGVHPVEQALPTPLFERGLRERGLSVTQGWQAR